MSYGETNPRDTNPITRWPPGPGAQARGPPGRRKSDVFDPIYRPPKKDEPEEEPSSEGEPEEDISAGEASNEEDGHRAIIPNPKPTKRKVADSGDSKYVPLPYDESSEEISKDGRPRKRKKQAKSARASGAQISRPATKRARQMGGVQSKGIAPSKLSPVSEESDYSDDETDKKGGETPPRPPGHFLSPDPTPIHPKPKPLGPRPKLLGIIEEEPAEEEKTGDPREIFRTRLPTKKLSGPPLIFPSPRTKMENRTRDWPPYPGAVYCIPCFTLEVLKAFRIRRNTLHTLRLLGGNNAFRTFIDQQKRLDILEQEATDYLRAGKGVLLEGDTIHKPGSTEPYLAFHDRLPADLKGLIHLQLFVHELLPDYDVPVETAFPKVATMLKAIRKDLNLTHIQLLILEQRFPTRHLPIKTHPDQEYAIPLEEGEKFTRGDRFHVTQILDAQREKEHQQAEAAAAASDDSTFPEPKPIFTLWNRQAIAQENLLLHEPRTASLIHTLEKKLGILIIPTAGNENLNHHMAVISYLKIENRIYDVCSQLVKTVLDLSTSEHSGHIRWPCTHCGVSEATNRALASRDYPRDEEEGERRAWTQTVSWMLPSIIGNNTIKNVATGEFAGLLKRVYGLEESHGKEELGSGDEGFDYRIIADEKKKAVSHVQRMRGFEFVVCNVEDVMRTNERWKTRVVMLGVSSVFDEIRRVGRGEED